MRNIIQHIDICYYKNTGKISVYLRRDILDCMRSFIITKICANIVCHCVPPALHLHQSFTTVQLTRQQNWHTGKIWYINLLYSRINAEYDSLTSKFYRNVHELSKNICLRWLFEYFEFLNHKTLSSQCTLWHNSCWFCLFVWFFYVFFV